MAAYYNEIDPFAAAWLRELIKAGLIAPGDVDERSIHDVRPEDLAGYTQCHFFAGIGGWSYALRLASWPDDRPVWTGSCPCQPFSAAGKQAGTKDDRHLWPEFFRLIRESRPDTVFGEQVAAAIGLDWLDHVSDDLEGVGYAVGSIVLPACSVGAPHIRQRLWFVAESDDAERWTDMAGRYNSDRDQTGRHEGNCESGKRGETGELADTERRTPERHGYDMAAAPGGMQGETREQRLRDDTGNGSATRGFWHPADWIACRDGKARPVEPTIFPLATGIPNRVGLLRGAGNAIVPQVAAEVIRAYSEYERN